MGRFCQIMLEAFTYRDIPKGEGYDDYWLQRGIEYCTDYLADGYTREPISDFDLQEFIDWARLKIMEDKTISTAPEVDALIDAGAPLLICVSGGKDSRLAAETSLAYARSLNPEISAKLVYADLGRVVWSDAQQQCRQLAERLQIDLVIVRREAGGLMERWQKRWPITSRVMSISNASNSFYPGRRRRCAFALQSSRLRSFSGGSEKPTNSAR